MNIEDPRTPEEWEQYLDQFTAEQVLSKAKAANTNRFVGSMIKEGYSLQEVEGIFTMMAVKIKAGGFRPPMGTAFDLGSVQKQRVWGKRFPSMMKMGTPIERYSINPLSFPIFAKERIVANISDIRHLVMGEPSSPKRIPISLWV